MGVITRLNTLETQVRKYSYETKKVHLLFSRFKNRSHSHGGIKKQTCAARDFGVMKQGDIFFQGKLTELHAGAQWTE